ncbi:hypothetical protein CRYUN_Cryun18bG0074700 [Craigia yunnanensis]
MLSAGTTHLAVTPLDILKVNMQVNPIKYSSISSGLSAGPSSLWRGWSGKFFGYGVQGGCKFGLYEYFKWLYSNVLVDQTGLPYSFSAVHLLRYLLMWISVFSKPLKFVFRHSPILQRVWFMDFQNFIKMKGLLASTRDFVHFGAVIFHAVKKIGLVNLFTRSLPVRITLVGPVVTLQWFFYNTIKVLCGLYSHSSNNVNILGLLVEDLTENYKKPIYHLKLFGGESTVPLGQVLLTSKVNDPCNVGI